MKIVDVAAAVILRPDGSFLLARRPAGKAYAGYWEFPGGKVEAGEPVEAALSRELYEELGIEVERADPWITRVFAYPHATVRLHFFRVRSFRNAPHPREQQAIAWQRLGAPMADPMLPANAPVLAALRLPDEYAVTDAARLGSQTMLAALERRLAGGLKLLQVREPGLPEHEREAFTRSALALAHSRGCLVLTKAFFPGADGIHLPASQTLTMDRRPEAKLAAASCHTRGELEKAMQLGLDFAVLGPVKPTASHPGSPPLGWQEFASIVRGASIPVYAIGGLEGTDLDAAWRAGAHGVALLSAAWR